MSLVLHCLWLMEHQKPISAQCDTFLRIRVCQGHINIANEQKAYWRDIEWQKEDEEANRNAEFIFVSNMMYIYLWFWWWLPPHSHFEWWRDTLCPGIPCDYLPSVWRIGTNGWLHLFFYIHLENHISFCSFMPSGEGLGSIERELLIYVKTAIFIWVCSSAGLRSLITQKRGKQKWNAIMQLFVWYLAKLELL